MFENNTYQVILERMLARVPEEFDKMEGSILYDALAPAAAELQIAYISLESVFREMFADTASRDCLIRRAAERGISPYPATHAILKGIFTPASAMVPIGARFRCGGHTFQAVAKEVDGEYRMECEGVGEAGNLPSGELIPIDYIDGLEGGRLAGILIPGEDEEETEHLRKRYFASLESQAFGGNVADYKAKVTAIPGVGGVKVYPAWAGGGTVKLVLVNSEYKIPSETLIDSVQKVVDPPPDQGKGYGIAPIGHKVTILPVSGAIIDLGFELVYQDGYGFENVKDSIGAAVEAYFDELNRTWAEGEGLVIRVSRLEGRILDIAGILDVTATRINGQGQNIALGKDEVAIKGEIHEI